MSDILFRKKDYIFSYRVAEICIQNDKILLQKPIDDNGFSFPGGHVAFGETNEETLIREFKEEIDADITVMELNWVEENFFLWDETPCHQICMYYRIKIDYKNIPTSGIFIAKEQLEGHKFKVEFHWIPVENLGEIKIYPKNTVELLNNLKNGIHHFISKD